MKVLRAVVAGALAVLMGGGYFASQTAFFQGNALAYKEALDASPVRWLALLLLLAVIVLFFIPNREEEQA